MATIDFGLIDRLTDLLLCSRCLRLGRRTPVMQVVSPRHRPRSLCVNCVKSGKLTDAPGAGALVTLSG